ncbi:hypothetical protein L195_g005874 [Trifolium pratense]|uniref:Uncharacterized protein n=1 Tax=Trifolium pratense TaxID=57577 RepID=A0A2K3P220_TRIPR|nr:hypothetical protein L195_g005874 [Trifolium pratense]
MMKKKKRLISHCCERKNESKFELDSDPDSARIFFQWVLENYPEKLTSESYNQVLSYLGLSGAVQEFWDLVVVMNKKGFAVSKWVIDTTLDYFQKNGMDVDAFKLKELFDNDTVERLCRIIRNNVWSHHVEKQITDLNLVFSNQLVKLVLFNLGSEPNKALIFFRWIEETGLFKHDVCTSNAMTRVLERKNSIDQYWELFLKDDGAMLEHDMEEETFVNVWQNGENAKIGVMKKKENENTSPERIPIMESDMTISKLKQLIEEKEQCILQHKEQVKKFKRRILHDHCTKQGQSTLFKRLRKSFKAAIEELETEFQDKCQKQEKHFAETEKRCHKILAYCSEESTSQQLMMHIQQCQNEQLIRLRQTSADVWDDFCWVIQISMDVGQTFAKVLQNDENAKIEVEKLEENETTSVERIQIMESDMTISELKQLLEEKEQCILQHKEQEEKFKCRILHDHYMKQGQSTLLKRLRKKIYRMSNDFEAVIEIRRSDFKDMFEKQEKYFAETEERCRKILADCSEESKRQQLMMHIQQCHSEQLNHLRDTTIAVWNDFDEVIKECKLFLYYDHVVMLEELREDYYESSSEE